MPCKGQSCIISRKYLNMKSKNDLYSLVAYDKEAPDLSSIFWKSSAPVPICANLNFSALFASMSFTSSVICSVWSQKQYVVNKLRKQHLQKWNARMQRCMYQIFEARRTTEIFFATFPLMLERITCRQLCPTETDLSWHWFEFSCEQ